MKLATVILWLVSPLAQDFEYNSAMAQQDSGLSLDFHSSLPPHPLNPSPASALPPSFGAFEAFTTSSRAAVSAVNKTTAASFSFIVTDAAFEAILVALKSLIGAFSSFLCFFLHKVFYSLSYFTFAYRS